MTQATSTTLGEIKLAGDLAGSNNALLPELTATGVVAGSYPMPKLTIDAKGRVLTATTSSSADILALIPDATKLTKGVVRVGDNINVTTSAGAGYQTIFFNPGLTTGALTGLCPNSGNYTATITIDGTAYLVSIAGLTVVSIADLISSINTQLGGAASLSISSGNLVITSTLTGTSSTVVLSLDKLFMYMTGYQSVGSSVIGTGLSTIWVYDASDSTKGVAKFGTGLTVINGAVSVDISALPAATTTTLGLVKIGSGITNTSGVISVPTTVDATVSVKGIVQVGSNINVTGGVISVPEATDVTKGVVQAGTGLSMSSGIIAVNSTMWATNSTRGVLKVGSGLSVTSGTIDLASFASTTSAGLVKIGNGVNIDGAGIISTTAGAIADATAVSKGLVQIGTNISVAAGVISIVNATAASKGVVQVSTSNGLTITSGVVNVALASLSDFGVVTTNNSNNITISAGLIDVGTNVAKLDTANTYTKAQVVALSTIASGASITPDFSLSNTFYLDATSNFTLNAPTNVVAGGTYYIIVKQDATGSRLITWNSAFKFRGVVPTLSTLATRTDVIAIVAQSSTVLLTELQKGYA